MCIKVQISDNRKSLLHSLVKAILTYLEFQIERRQFDVKLSDVSDLFIRRTEKVIPDK